MKELVRRLHQKRMRVAPKVFARRTDRDRVAMLERAVGAILKEECVVAIGRVTEQRNRLAHRLLHTRNERGGVERHGIGQRPVDDAMRDTSLDKSPLPEASDQNRIVHECRGVLGHKPVRIDRSSEAGGDRPASRQIECDHDRHPLGAQ